MISTSAASRSRGSTRFGSGSKGAPVLARSTTEHIGPARYRVPSGFRVQVQGSGCTVRVTFQVHSSVSRVRFTVSDFEDQVHSSGFEGQVHSSGFEGQVHTSGFEGQVHSSRFEDYVHFLPFEGPFDFSAFISNPEPSPEP